MKAMKTNMMVLQIEGGFICHKYRTSADSFGKKNWVNVTTQFFTFLHTLWVNFGHQVVHHYCAFNTRDAPADNRNLKKGKYLSTYV